MSSSSRFLRNCPFRYYSLVEKILIIFSFNCKDKYFTMKINKGAPIISDSDPFDGEDQLAITREIDTFADLIASKNYGRLSHLGYLEMKDLGNLLH